MISLPYEIPKPAVTDSEVPPVIEDVSMKPVTIASPSKKASKQQSNLQKLMQRQSSIHNSEINQEVKDLIFDKRTKSVK